MTTAIKSYGDKVACAPIPVGPQKRKQENGLVLSTVANALVSTKVVMPGLAANSFLKGTTVYLDGRCTLQPWAKNIYEVEVEGKPVQFILVPITEVILVEWETWSPTKEGPGTPG